MASVTMLHDSAALPTAAEFNAVDSARASSRVNSPVDMEDLTRAIVRGNDAAFETFYDLYGPRLYRLLLVLGRGDEELAREIQQIVMIKVARKFKVFAGDQELWAWLSQVARNAFVDHLRQQARLPGQACLDLLLCVREFSDSTADQTLLDFLEAGLAELEPEERGLIEEVYFQDRAQKELAAANGKSLKAIESKLARSREKLRQFIFERMHHERENA